MGVAEEFGPGKPPHQGNVVQILLRSATVIGEGVLGLMSFGLLMMLSGFADGGG